MMVAGDLWPTNELVGQSWACLLSDMMTVGRSDQGRSAVAWLAGPQVGWLAGRLLVRLSGSAFSSFFYIVGGLLDWCGCHLSDEHKLSLISGDSPTFLYAASLFVFSTRPRGAAHAVWI